MSAETQRGWNRCSECGRAARPEDLEEWEHSDLGLYGELKQEWGLAHKRHDDCPAYGPVSRRNIESRREGA